MLVMSTSKKKLPRRDRIRKNKICKREGEKKQKNDVLEKGQECHWSKELPKCIKKKKKKLTKMINKKGKTVFCWS